MQKDIHLARKAASELATPLPSAAVADEMLTRASELGYAHRDLAALHEVLAKPQGTWVLGQKRLAQMASSSEHHPYAATDDTRSSRGTGASRQAQPTLTVIPKRRIPEATPKMA